VKGLVASGVDVSRSQWSHVGLGVSYRPSGHQLLFFIVRGVAANEGNISSVLTGVSCKLKLCKCR
jgi:hypothetical protein